MISGRNALLHWGPVYCHRLNHVDPRTMQVGDQFTTAQRSPCNLWGTQFAVKSHIYSTIGQLNERQLGGVIYIAYSHPIIDYRKYNNHFIGRKKLIRLKNANVPDR